jgi:hypothetical protein
MVNLPKALTCSALIAPLRPFKLTDLEVCQGVTAI